MPYPKAIVLQAPFGPETYGSRFGLVDQWHKNPHRGTDFRVPTGSEVRSVATGRVIDIRPLSRSQVLGNVITVASKFYPHVGKPWDVFFGYCHLSRFATGLKVGQTVIRNDVIAYSGNTGSASAGAHLHLTASREAEGVFYGNVFDPIAFIDANDYHARGILVGGKR